MIKKQEEGNWRDAFDEQGVKLEAEFDKHCEKTIVEHWNEIMESVNRLDRLMGKPL